jgi:phage terminase small subunit
MDCGDGEPDRTGQRWIAPSGRATAHDRAVIKCPFGIHEGKKAKATEMDKAKPRPRAPEGLDKAGRALWRSVLADYELSPAELATLAQACKVVDLLVKIDAALAVADVVSEGAMGQPKSHPLLASAADQRRLLSELLRDLCLPMPFEDEGHRRSPRAAEAAAQRWAQERGRG